MKPTINKINKILLITGLSVTFIIILLLVLPIIFSEPEKIYIGLIGPMTGEKQKEGLEMERGASLYIDKINEQGGVNGIQLELSVFDDQNDPETAKQKGLELVKENKALTVIGHLYSSASLSTGTVYQENKMPAITTTAGSSLINRGNRWYFRLMTSNSFQAQYIANYASQGLNKKSAAIIYEKNDLYCSDLTENFQVAADKLNMEIKIKWGFDPNDEKLGEKLRAVGKTLKELDDSTVVFLATSVPAGIKVITYIKHPGTQFTIICPDPFSDKSFIDTLKSYPQEKAIPGYYSKNIYTISPFMKDLSNEKAQIFRNEYIKKYEEEPTWITAGNYEAMLACIEAIKETYNKDAPIEENRANIIRWLSNLNIHTNNTIKGIRGDIFFDQQGGCDKPFPMGIYTNQRLITAPVQYQLLSDLSDWDKLFKGLIDGEIILIDGKYMKKTHVVYTGTDIQEVSDIDTGTSSYIIDFFLWFRYLNILESQGYDVSDIEFVNSAEPVVLDTPIIREKDGETTTVTYRVRTDFKSEFNLRDYPFDKHTLYIKLRHKILPRESLIYVNDTLGMSKGSNRSNGFNLKPPDGWEINDVYFYQDIDGKGSTLGLPKFFESDAPISYSRFNAAIDITRAIKSFLIKNFLLIFFMVATCFTGYLMPADDLGTRLGLASGTFTTTALFHLSISSTMSAKYLMAIEYSFWSVYLLVTISIVVYLYTYMKNKDYEEKKAEAKEEATEEATEEEKEEEEKELAFIEKKISIATMTGEISHGLIIAAVIIIYVVLYG